MIPPSPPTPFVPTGKASLLIAAAPAEARAVAAAAEVPAPDADWHVVRLNERWDLVRSGVGKVNAALCASRCIDPSRHTAIMSIGICGVLPGCPLGVGSVIVADRSIYADEGIATPDGFQDIAAAGFGPGGVPSAFTGCGLYTDPILRSFITVALKSAGIDSTTGTIATISTCSGTNALARDIARRAGAITEAMEGAAIAHAIARLHGPSIAFAEVRVVSNTTGDRAQQRWDLKGALEQLTVIARTLISRT